MIQMKKVQILALILCFAMLFCLSACGGGDSQEDPGQELETVDPGQDQGGGEAQMNGGTRSDGGNWITAPEGIEIPEGGTGIIEGTDITKDNLTEFYWTYENINYNAEFLRYYYHPEGDKKLLSFERRQRFNEYGPASEEDITAQGTVELTDEQWAGFFSFLEDDDVRNRSEDVTDGDSGPWTFIYYSDGPDQGQEFYFGTVEERIAFENYSASLAGIEELAKGVHF